MVLQRNQQIGRKNKHIFERFTYHLRAPIPPNFAYRFHLDFMHLMHRFYPDFACQIHLNFAHGFHLDFARRFYLDFAHRFHLCFVGATTGRPLFINQSDKTVRAEISEAYAPKGTPAYRSQRRKAYRKGQAPATLPRSAAHRSQHTPRQPDRYCAPRRLRH